MRKLVLAVFLVAAATMASANPLILSPVSIYHQYQQATNNPCVIGDPSCHNPAGFDVTIFPAGGNVTAYDSLSPVYTVAQIRSLIGNNIVIGIDINQTNETQKLSLFTMSINGVVVDTYSANPATLVPPTPGGGNGNGYADYLLTGFTSLAGYNDTDTVQFHVVMPLVNDGREEYFLIAGNAPPTPTPEPSTLVMLGSGLLGAAGVIRRKYLL